MQVNNYLRIALMFGESKAHTLYKNLERMIALVLYDAEKETRESQKNNGQFGLSVIDIIDQLKSRYSLNFSDSEILKAIENRKQSRIICIDIDNYSAQKKYAITPEEYEKITQRENNKKLSVYIKQFLDEHTDVTFSEEEMQELLNKHFYCVFNSNAATILDLINRNYDYTENLSIKQFEFSIEEKATINQFLYWNDPGKNKCVYEMVSCCFDYCMMTTKHDSDAFKGIFNQKVFYLDANIIFRLMGLNHESRRRVIDTFIKKCKEQKVRVRITNHTRQEIADTIEYHVKGIRHLLRNTSPLQPKAVRDMSTTIVNQSFYQAYYDWCLDPINTYNDYQNFEHHLKKQANEILYQFEQKDFESFAETDKQHFSTLVDSLSEYKKEHHRKAYDENIKTDVNNFLFVSSCNEKTKGSDFLSIHNYLISADHTFGDWAKEIKPGSIPVVILPSVWYSIMLQYSGRSDDDYASFTSFLNFSLSNNDSSENSDRKLDILKRVITLDERADIKSEIIYEIEEKLNNKDTLDLESEDIEVLIKEAHQGILDREVTRARAEERSIADEDRAKTENALHQKMDEAIQKERKRIIEYETEKQTTNTLRKYWLFTIVMFLLSIGAVAGIAYWISLQKELTEVQKAELEWIKIAMGIIATAGTTLIIKVIFKGLDREKIETCIRKRVEKEYSE